MEDVLDVYTRPYDPQYPMVCVDETSKQLVGEVETPLPAVPGYLARYDHHYMRNGVANLFMMLEPLRARREISTILHGRFGGIVDVWISKRCERNTSPFCHC